MHCPLDHCGLEPVSYEGALIQSCPTCGGELLSADAMQHVISTRDRVHADTELATADGAGPLPGVPLGEQGRHLTCPCCSGHMDQFNFAGDTRVIVDRCACCGALWLDRHELEMAQVLLERWSERAAGQRWAIAGSLAEARRQAADKAGGEFRWSRFAFVNAVLNRIVDAA